MIDEKGISRIVQQCWDIAENVKLGTTIPEMYINNGNGGVNSVRWQTYLCLLNCLLPRPKMLMSAEMSGPKEDWQE